MLRWSNVLLRDSNNTNYWHIIEEKKMTYFSFRVKDHMLVGKIAYHIAQFEQAWESKKYFTLTDLIMISNVLEPLSVSSSSPNVFYICLKSQSTNVIHQI